VWENSPIQKKVPSQKAKKRGRKEKGRKDRNLITENSNPHPPLFPHTWTHLAIREHSSTRLPKSGVRIKGAIVGFGAIPGFSVVVVNLDGS